MPLPYLKTFIAIDETSQCRSCKSQTSGNTKGRSDFDAPTCADLAVAASHVNSYPRAALGGRCPVDAARALLPEGFVDLPGVVKVPLEEVMLRPSLLPHAVDR